MPDRPGDPDSPLKRVSSIELKSILTRQNERLVLAESCTAGLVAALLGACPGISNVFCGSFVVYRTHSKQQWLGIDPDLLADPERGPVSAEATLELAYASLERTPEASLAAAVTGHLGPGVESALDGVIYIAVVHRNSRGTPLRRRIQLATPAARSESDWEARQSRQREAADWVLATIGSFLSDASIR